MARTPSTMLDLGTPAPDFSLLDTISGRTLRLADFSRKKALVVMFICNHCPFVKHILPGLVALGNDYEDKDAAIVAISSNDGDTYPDDSPRALGEAGRKHGFRFPYLHDADQAVAKAYRAACTPDFFLFDARRRLVYRGQLDGSRPDNGVPVTGHDLRAAIDAVIAGRDVPVEQKPSIGCNIKWKPGNEPDYYR